ncbi:MAG TPA: type II secretion system protein [Candidatus Acidoferrum sp.]|nr:type II secretion system protein [Candidatus Acidoferrum sp.]
MHSPQPHRRRGFTILELLAVIATIGTLAALLLPVLGKAKIKAQRTTCLSNLRQLGYAWVMYKDENEDYLTESYPVNNADVWVQGDMTKAAEAGNTDLIRAGKLYNYNQNVAIYHCPADQGVVIDGTLTPTVRSYSMNCFMGARDPSVGLIPSTAKGYVPFYSTYAEIPRPSQLWVMLDEDERSINDGFFVTDPTGMIWFDFPANSAHRHNYSFTLTFADAHAEVWHYRDPHSMQVSMSKTEQPGNADLARLANAAVTPK